MSSNLDFYEIRSFVRRKVKWSDILYNQKYFLKIAFLFLFPKFKAGVFNNPEMTPGN